jgi:hypothetical protein
MLWSCGLGLWITSINQPMLTKTPVIMKNEKPANKGLESGASNRARINPKEQSENNVIAPIISGAFIHLS